MKRGTFLIFAVVAILLGKINSTEFEEEEPNVYQITDGNFDEIIKKFSNLFVKFYAPWCGHCKQLAPEFNKAAKELQEKGVNVAFGNIDATVQTQLAAKYQVKGYPTVKMFIDGVPISYESGRESKDIVEWIEKKLSKVAVEVKIVEELDQLTADNKVVVAYFGEKNDQYELFTKLVKQFDDIAFVYSFDQVLKAHFNTQTIVLFKQFDEKRNDYLEEFDVAKIYEFIAEHSVPTILEFDQKAAQMIFGEQKDALFSEFEVASKELKSKLVLTKSVIDQGLGQRFAEYVGVTEKMLPIVFILKVVGQEIKKYKLEKEITSENLLTFYNDYTEGKLINTIKSEEIPEQNEGPVIKIVSKQFNQIVMDPTKDVLVKYYAPWCGHCKHLAPIYEKIAQELNNPNIILAEYDATANENEEVSIKGFPTLIFYPAKNKAEPVNYDGERNEESIIKFLKEHATVDWIEPQKTEEVVEEQKSEL